MLVPADLAPFAVIPEAKALAMIADARAMAFRVAPCLVGLNVALSEHGDAVKAILRRAILRWHDVGSGAVTQQTAGSFSQSVDTTRSSSKSLFWPSEVADLQAICRDIDGDTGPDRAVFTINTGRRSSAYHSPICDLYFGGLDCSCGSSLNGFLGPLDSFGEVML